MEELALMARPSISRHARSQWDARREKQVLLAPERVLVLNETATAIVNLCDGRRSVAEITGILNARYHRDVAADVLAFLSRLLRQGMLEADRD